jgi:hypothetical protein
VFDDGVVKPAATAPLLALDWRAPRSKVERIHGAVLLISGGDDGVGESAPMAN